MTVNISAPSTTRWDVSAQLRWPGGQRIAAVANVAYEGWSDGKTPGIGPAGNPLPAGAFDSNSRSWGDYGADHGIHRLLRALERAKARGSVMVSGILAERFPQNVRAIVDAGHEVSAHSYAQDIVPATLSADEDRANIDKTTQLLEQVTGTRPTGWISPRFTQGAHTAEALANAGYRWHGDAMDADLPYEQTFEHASIVAVPFS